MARSRRHTPVFGNTTAESDALWKAKAARKLRRRVRQTIQAGRDLLRFAGKRWDIVDPWTSEKDGKFWYQSPPPKFWRK